MHLFLLKGEVQLYALTDIINIDVGDLNGDTYPDIFAISGSNNDLSWYPNDGSDGISGKNFVKGTFENHDVHVADVDNDGDLDAVASFINGGTTDRIVWFENDGTGSATPYDERVIATDLQGIRNIYPSDLDSDGDLDIITAELGANRVRWYRNDNGSFTTNTIITTAATGVTCVSAGDLNGDGWLDVISGGGTGKGSILVSERW